MLSLILYFNQFHAHLTDSCPLLHRHFPNGFTALMIFMISSLSQARTDFVIGMLTSKKD